MAEDSDVEKTEPASERKLAKAREDGQIPRSRELVTFLLLLAGVGTLWLGAPRMYESLRSVLRQSLNFDTRRAFDTAAMLESSLAGAAQALLAMAPLLFILAAVAILGSVALGGLVFVSKPLQPNLDKLNPIKGLGRMFSMNTLVELGKSLVKAVLVGSVATFVISQLLDEMLVLMHVATSAALAKSLNLVALCCAVVIASLVVIALFDAPYQIWNYLKNLRMSHQDLKQEHKESEGDPHLKGRIRQQQRQMARGRMMAAVPEADVVVTNPTHYAVALKYEEGGASAPRVVAKGAGLIAQRIREIAAENDVPLLSAPPLARALYHHVELDAEIPATLYSAVAEVLAWVFQLRTWRTHGGTEPGRPANLAVPAALDPRSATS